MGLRDLITHLDYFGHSIQLNFKKKGPEHKTLAGGIMSCLVNIIMTIYIGLLLKRMILYEDDEITSSVLKLNAEDFKPVQYNEMSRSMFFEILMNDGSKFTYDDETKKYVRLSATYSNTIHVLEGVMNLKESDQIEIRPCVSDDFQRTQKVSKLWQEVTNRKGIYQNSAYFCLHPNQNQTLSLNSMI